MSDLEPSRNSIWLPRFYRFKAWAIERPRLRKYGATILVAGILLTPSIWMLSVIPPLWRDVDAHIQVAHPPGPGTILHYGPLYPFIARIPFYLGHAIGCVKAGAPLPTPAFLIHPVLSDSGVFALLLSQHAALCCSSFYLIMLTSRLFWIRLVVAVAWVTNPLFYTFAHCVGSETLSMILLLLVGATGLKIIRRRRSVPRKEWLLFGILLWLSILARHINAVLAGLMPLTFIILAAYHSIIAPLAWSQLLARWRRLMAKQALQKATIAFTVGISCIVVANASVLVLCQEARIPYYSTAGFTFLFRLKFLGELSPEKRNQLLDEVMRHTASADVKKFISLLRNAFPSQDRNWDVMAFIKRAQESLFTRKSDPQGQKFHVLLNRTEKAFLCPPNTNLLAAVATDFKRSQQSTIPSVVGQLFGSTAFLLSVPEVMPAYASLWTFRGKSAAQIVAVYKRHAYFRRPKGSYTAFLVLSVVNLAVLVVLGRMRKEEIATVASYATGLTLAGLFMTLANCFLNEFQPRYTLPMWELTIVCSSILFGKAMDCLFRSRTRSVCDQPLVTT
jgi:hypothetical protein